jgi:GNAT superfamily N-acetyltransferase
MHDASVSAAHRRSDREARFHIRRIGPGDGARLKALRLRALTEAPEAFGESVAEADARDEAEYAARARAASGGERRAWFLAERDADPSPAAPGSSAAGLAMGRRRPPDECMIFSVWVEEAARGQGVGRALVEAVGDWSRSWGARRLVLWVFRSNRGAIDFYQRLGFAIEVAGPDAELGAPHDAVAMHRTL